MKRIVFLAVSLAAALGARAQQNDTISVMFQQISRTNAEISQWEKGMNMHAAMVGVGGAALFLGAVSTSVGSREVRLGELSGQKLINAGMAASIFGAAFIAASFIPLPKPVHLDERGLIVDLPTEGKRRK